MKKKDLKMETICEKLLEDEKSAAINENGVKLIVKIEPETQGESENANPSTLPDQENVINPNSSIETNPDINQVESNVTDDQTEVMETENVAETDQNYTRKPRSKRIRWKKHIIELNELMESGMSRVEAKKIVSAKIKNRVEIAGKSTDESTKIAQNAKEQRKSHKYSTRQRNCILLEYEDFPEKNWPDEYKEQLAELTEKGINHTEAVHIVEIQMEDDKNGTLRDMEEEDFTDQSDAQEAPKHIKDLGVAKSYFGYLNSGVSVNWANKLCHMELEIEREFDRSRDLDKSNWSKRMKEDFSNCLYNGATCEKGLQRIECEQLKNQLKPSYELNWIEELNQNLSENDSPEDTNFTPTINAIPDRETIGKRLLAKFQNIKPNGFFKEKEPRVRQIRNIPNPSQEDRLIKVAFQGLDPITSKKIKFDMAELREIEEAILNVITSDEATTTGTLKFHSRIYNPGYLTINCEDIESALWFKENCSKIAAPQGRTLTVKIRISKDSGGRVMGEFPFSSNYSNERIFNIIDAMNDGLDPKTWYVESRFNDGRYAIVTMFLPASALAKCRQLNGEIFYRFQKIRLVPMNARKF